jgi:hypothetical protein
MKRRFWLLTVEFFAITTPLAWLWLEWGRMAYLRFFLKLSTPILVFLGVSEFQPRLVQEHFLNYVPFLVLMVITPELTIRRRIIGTIVGFVIIFFDHIGLVSMAFVAHSKYGLSAKAFSTLFPALLFSDSLPFILWAIIASSYLKKAVAGLKKRSGG